MLRNISHAIVIGSTSFVLIALANSLGIELFDGLFNSFGLLLWTAIVFVDLCLMRI